MAIFPNTGLGIVAFIPLSFILPITLVLIGCFSNKWYRSAIFTAIATVLILVSNTYYFPADTLENTPWRILIRLLSP